MTGIYKDRTGRALRLWLTGLAVWLAASTLHAEENGWYGGGGLGASNYEGRDVDEDLGKRGLTGNSELGSDGVPWGLFFGYRSSGHYGFEAGYFHLDRQAGDTRLVAPVQDTVDAVKETDGFYLLVHGSLPVATHTSVVANLGAYLWKIETSAASLAGQTAVSATKVHRGLAPRYGLGVEQAVSGRSALRLYGHRFLIDGENSGVLRLDFVHYLGTGG